MFGREVEHDFYRCTGWPLISAGFWDSFPLSKMLEEATLYPCKAEIEIFYRMLKGVVPFMNNELRWFYIPKNPGIINDVSYEIMLSLMVGNIDNFLMMINEEAKTFNDLFKANCT